MSVSIQDVLALLPELFPGTQSIPYANLHPNPENPGPALTDSEIQELADNLAERGLVNPIKVQPDPVNPLVPGVKLHPDNPRITAEGRPWALGDFNYRILAGERRYRSAGRLKWEALPGFILNPTAEEAVEITHLDNDVRDRGWWAGYQSIEQLVRANPGLTQRQVAARLKLSVESVNRAVRLLPLLNPEARGLIVRNPNNSNKGIRGISESAAFRLADLGPGSTLKPGVKKTGEDNQRLWPYPAIPVDTQDLVRRTLGVAIDEQMTEAGVKGLVRWVQDGGKPEGYQAKGAKVGSAPKVKAEEPETDGDEEEDGESYKPLPWSEDSKHPEFLQIPTSRIRVNSVIAVYYSHALDVERKALSMQATGYAGDIRIRSLSEEEKKADPDHDYEAFDGILALEGAKKLGWPNLNAMVYAIDQWEGIRFHSVSLRHSIPLTWVEVYEAIEKMLLEDPSQTLAELAVTFEEDPEVAIKVFPVLKLLNESTRVAISESVHRCHEGRVDIGGHRFSERLAITLARLEGGSKNPQEIQQLVERVVGIVIENEMYSKEIEELVDWVLAGNDPGEYFEKEA